MSAALIAAVLPVAIACEAEGGGADPSTGAAPEKRAAVPESAAADDSVLACNPTDLRVSDTLALRLPRPHGPYLAVQAPDSTMYFLVFPAGRDSSPGARLSLMPADSFVSLASLRLPVRDLRAVPWVFGRDSAEIVFARPGLYRVLVAHDLETDAPIIQACSVRYISNKGMN